MSKVHVKLKVNGQDVEGLCEPRTLLVHFIRENLVLTTVRGFATNMRAGAVSREASMIWLPFMFMVLFLTYVLIF